MRELLWGSIRQISILELSSEEHPFKEDILDFARSLVEIVILWIDVVEKTQLRSQHIPISFTPPMIINIAIILLHKICHVWCVFNLAQGVLGLNAVDNECSGIAMGWEVVCQGFSRLQLQQTKLSSECEGLEGLFCFRCSLAVKIGTWVFSLGQLIHGFFFFHL